MTIPRTTKITMATTPTKAPAIGTVMSGDGSPKMCVLYIHKQLLVKAKQCHVTI